MKFIERLLFWAELALGMTVMVMVVFGLFMLVTSISQLPAAAWSWGSFHDTFEKLMINLLLLVIGLEMTVMMIRRRIELLPEILAFVTARKLLIITSTTYDLLLGVGVIAGLFVIRKYLVKCEDCLRFERLVHSGEIKQDKK